jgi:alkylated DNA repair dioxygenase AlkB
MLVMTGDSRYMWTHEIPKRLSVKTDGKNIKKPEDYRRISLTFRKTVR